MLTATLIVSQPGYATREVESDEIVTTIGSALDNVARLEESESVAYYHAAIELRDDGYWLSDFGNRQGTKVNGEPVILDRLLADGDHITLGDDCVIEFYFRRASPRPDPSTVSGDSRATSELGHAASSATGAGLSASSANVSGATSSNASTNASTDSAARTGGKAAPDAGATGAGMSPAKIGIGIGAGVLLTGVVALLVFNPFGGDCQPSVRFLTPLNGATLRAATTIRVEAREPQCIKRISYQLDGEEVASASTAPYEVTLDPSRLGRFASGTHVLAATVETADGAQARQSGEIYVALSSSNEGPRASPSPTAEKAATPEEPAVQSNAPVNAADVQVMSERLASQITGKSGYIFEREMVAKIQARAGEFAAVDASARALRQRQQIVGAFSRNGLKPLVGFVLALSRSKLADASHAEGADWWRVPPSIAQVYLQPGETTAVLNDPRRSAQIAAVYLKELLGTLDGDLDLAVACYGSTMEEAGALDQQLRATPAIERRNFWLLYTRGLVKPEQAERVVNFYAAGIVGENPQRFGSASRQPLSALE
jgi:hypothetical protein